MEKIFVLLRKLIFQFWRLNREEVLDRMNSQNEVSQFLKLANDWSPGFHKMVRTFLAFKHNGKWCLEYSIVIFLSDLNEEADRLVHPIAVETESLLAVRELLDIDETQIDSNLNKIRSNPFSLRFPDDSISVSDEALQGISYYFEPMHRRDTPGNWRLPALTVSTGSNLTSNHFPNREKLDLELRSNAVPFAGTDDLFETLGIPQSTMQRGYSSPTSDSIHNSL